MLFSTDTIVAVATPAGHGGIGIVRLSGPEACAIALSLTGLARLRPWRVQHAQVRDREGAALDEVLVSYFAAPKSFTGEDVVEISAHGSPVLLAAVVEASVAHGARLAEPGEFTRRAFLNGRIDLTQAEAIRDLIEAQTLLQARSAARQMYGSLSARLQPHKQALKELIALMEAGIDFADDDVPVASFAEIGHRIEELERPLAALAASFSSGRLVRGGLGLAIVGRPNVGKSSLFNRLVKAERAIVTATAGTTRDLVTESVNLGGVPLRFTDTAGIRQASEEAERLGVERSWAAMADADLVLVVLDGSEPLTADDRPVVERAASTARSVFVINKADLPQRLIIEELASQLAQAAEVHGDGSPAASLCRVSATTGQGIEELRSTIQRVAMPDLADGGELITNQRHAQHLSVCCAALARARDASDAAVPHEAILVDLYEAIAELDALTGQTTVEDILGVIFSTFCIGK